MTWLPPYHDMGLIGGLLQPLGVGMQVVILPPLAVVQRPARWLKAISRYGATVSGGPCFGYEACVQRTSADDRADLDLSSWKLAYCGAEPVRAETLQSFADEFASAGFNASALHPCYGLAEATLFVTGANGGRGMRTTTVDRATLRDSGRAEPQPDLRAPRTLTSCGWPWNSAKVSICHPETNAVLPDRTVGEIRVRGEHLAAGYYKAQEPSAAFQGNELRTGDLGFLDAGELYLVGRLKDVAIIRGVKHHAEDLEAVAHEAHPSLAQGSAVAFATQGGERELLVICHELGPRWLRRVDYREVEAAIAARIVQRCGVRPDIVLVLKSGALPRTSSGKIARHICREGFARGVWPAEAKIAGRMLASGETAEAAS